MQKKSIIQKNSALKSESPIGIFDSGIGGLTVFKALRKLMPQENMIYFGDTAHLPYGSKSRASIIQFSVEIARFLCQQKIKALVVACNTSSAVALSAIKKAVSVPVEGVIVPGAQACVRKGFRRIGVIGTEGTVRSGAYAAEIKKFSPGARVFEVACPLFVPLVEEGWWKYGVTEEVARIYLKPLQKARVDSLVLGCTHYPVIKPVISLVMGKDVSLIDSGEQTAQEFEKTLESLNLLRKRTGRGWSRFYVSDDPERFLRLSRRFLGSSILVKRVLKKNFE